MSNRKKLVREKFREAVFKRDNYKCCFCDITLNLDAHHITDRNLLPNGGYVKSNGITLCPEHHIIAEMWHESDGELFEIGFTPNDLYHKINSSLKLAISDSEKLK